MDSLLLMCLANASMFGYYLKMKIILRKYVENWLLSTKHNRLLYSCRFDVSVFVCLYIPLREK